MEDRISLELVTPHNLAKFAELRHVIMSQPDRHASFGSWSTFAVDAKDDWNQVLFVAKREGGGEIGIGWIDRVQQDERAEIGLALLPAYRGKGLGRIVGRLLLRYCFETLGCEKVESYALGSNPASVRMQKGGMVLQGVRARSAKIAGKFYDRWLFGLTRAAWEKQIAARVQTWGASDAASPQSEAKAGEEDPMSAEDRARFVAAAHAVQSGVATEMQQGSRDTEPKHLRVGVNVALRDLASLVKLLADKGVITLDEYERAIADGMEAEQAEYEARLSARMGAPVKLA